jgi:elongation factor Ts
VATVTAAMVKELRDRTGLGMMDCKRALTGVDGDLDRAIDELRKTSALKAAAKSGRTAADGLLAIKVGEDGKRASMVEVNVETDFAARNEKFIEFVDVIADAAFDARANDADELMKGDLDRRREELVQEIGENVAVRRVVTIEASEGRITSYLHIDKRKGALVELEGGDVALGRNIAMHVTALSPMVMTPEQVDTGLIEKEREIYTAQAEESGKPADIVAKMVEGRLRKYLAEISLVEQPFVKDTSNKVKVGKLLSETGAACKGFVRYEVGEGVERKQENFAVEVAAQAKAI